METDKQHLVDVQETVEQEEEEFHFPFAEPNDNSSVKVDSILVDIAPNVEEDECFLFLNRHKYCTFGVLIALFAASVMLTILFGILHYKGK